MNQKIQTIIWAILFSCGLCFAAKAQTNQSTSETATCKTQCSELNVKQTEDFEQKIANTQILHLIKQKSKPSSFNQGITVSN